MSGTRALLSQGYPAYDTDLQRLADQAAGAADEVWGGLAGPGGFWMETNPVGPVFAQADRTVTPLSEEGGTNVGIYHQLLVIPSPSAGKVRVLPALYQQAPTASPPATMSMVPALVARQTAAIDSATIGNNASGNPRIDLIYATIQRSTSVTGSRPFRDNTGVSTQTLNLATDPAVTITVLAGTPAGSPVPPALPADGGSAWNFRLAHVTVPNGYAGAAISASNIAQAWDRGGVRQEAMRAIVGGDAMDATTPALLSSRIGAKLTAFCPVTHTANPTTKTLILGAKQYDMRQRVIRVRGARPKVDTTYKAPASVTKGGIDAAGGFFDTGIVFTGTDGAVGTPCFSIVLGTAGSGSTSLTITGWADSATGDLNIKFAGANFGTDAWWIEVDFTGQFNGIR